MHKYTIAIAGNPNCGKTTLFNALTGSRQRVGNWPGVTVEKLEGVYSDRGHAVRVVDLPGIYSFSAYSQDEQIAREYILHDRPDVVVNIVDAGNLERNLYLTTQLLEMRVPVVVALNMMDSARRKGLRIEVDHLAAHLGCPVIPMVASRGKGFDELKEAIHRVASNGSIPEVKVSYATELENTIVSLADTVAGEAAKEGVDARWLALKLLEGDELAERMTGGAYREKIEGLNKTIVHHLGDDLDIAIADGRYGFIHGLSRDVVKRDEVRRSVSDMIDRVMLSRTLGIPVFLGIMYLVFMLTINVGGGFIDFFDILFGTLFVDGFGALLEGLGSPPWLMALLAGGVGGGLQTVATFIPPIFFIFLCLSFLEDSGYMARAAFVMDRFLRAIGLPGKAFLPMLVGFGCNVPGIMAARTLENERDRTMTVLMNPFMSCGARLPVYILFAAAFFPQSGSALIFGLYLTGILLSVMTGLLLRKTLLKGEASTFVMELPPYHMPTISGLLYHTWNKLKSFIVRAGQVIIIMVVILNLLNSVGTDGSFGHEDSGRSVLSAVGKSITPVFHPMGITDENWPATVGLFTGIFAKEAVVGTLDALYTQMDERRGGAAEGEEEGFSLWDGLLEAFASIPAAFEGFSATWTDPLGLAAARAASDGEAVAEDMHISGGTLGIMQRYFGGKAAAVAYLLFILIYAPCVAAIAAIYRETNWKWTVFSVGYLTGLAWMVSTLYYQMATFAAHPASSAGWIGGLLAGVVFFIMALRFFSPKKM